MDILDTIFGWMPDWLLFTVIFFGIGSIFYAVFVAPKIEDLESKINDLEMRVDDLENPNQDYDDYDKMS